MVELFLLFLVSSLIMSICKGLCLGILWVFFTGPFCTLIDRTST